MKVLKTIKRKGFLYASLFGAVLASLFLILSLLLPVLASSGYRQRRLGPLRHQAEAIRSEFTKLVNDINRRQRSLSAAAFPEKKSEIFSLLKKTVFDKEREGVAFFSREGGLILWLGNTVDIASLFSEGEGGIFFQQESSFVIRHKASVYLSSLKKVRENEYVIFFRLLSFVPQFKAPYLKEFHFLRAKLLTNCNIGYWDFREDVSRFEKLFSRHKDEYTGQPREEDKVETILFPLRNEEGKIAATVSLSSPSAITQFSALRENFLLAFYLLLGVSFVSFVIYLVKSPLFDKRSLPADILIVLTLIGLRIVFFPLSGLEKIQSLPIFSPSGASFLSVWNLTKSPADIFLTSAFLFLVVGCLFITSRSLVKNKKRKSPLILSLAVCVFSILTSIIFIFAFQQTLSRIVSNSNINLLRFSFNLSFFLLHLSILCLFIACTLVIFTAMKIVSRFSPNPLLPFCILFLMFGGYFLFFKSQHPLLLFILQALILSVILLPALFPAVVKRKELLLSALLLFTLFIDSSLDHFSFFRNRSLIQNSLHHIISSQEQWGTFLLNQSLQEVEKRKESVFSFLKSNRPYDLARSLWERTLVAKFNWYSSLVILDPDGEVLSHFSLNMPKPFRLDFDLPADQEWSTLRLTIPFMGEEKESLLGYKDWFDGDHYLGRTILYLSVDYDMLPFLYSANPYFELLRVTSIPSLDQFGFGFAIYDLKGKPVFNPDDISAGIPQAFLAKVDSADTSLWSSFTDKNKKYHSFYFRKENRIYSLFMPKKNFFNRAAEFLKLLFFYLLFFFIFLFLAAVLSGKKLKNLFWSFSNRVYVSFAAITLIPLILFTFFTRSFFGQIFVHHFTEKAEAQANLAQRVMEYFILFQQEEMVSPVIPSENVVLWISSTISNDVNLYQDGRLASSSRREYFDYGLLPDLIDGEIYYKIQYENNPFFTQTQKIGDYSFHTLTTPFSFEDSLLLISLPFPLEQQETSKATEELIEFLFFISVFLIAVVLIFARGIGQMIVAPVRKLLIGTREVSMGNLDISIVHNVEDEMKTLIDGFNAMVKNLRRQQQELAEMSKKAAWAEMARKVAHEIKNPLTPIQLSAEHLLKVYQDRKGDIGQALKESASYIISEVENLRKIAQEFLDISREKILRKESFDLRKLIQETISPYKKMLSEKIRFKENYKGEDLIYFGDKDKIRIALRNLFANAVEAIRDRGKIEIEAAKEESGIVLEIRDTGVGMNKEVMDNIFEPYFSTKEVGTGLGLPIARKIIEDHGGSIQVSSREGEGTKIAIKLPLEMNKGD